MHTQVLYFRNPLTPTGALGSAIAIVGVMLYSLAKASAAKPPAIVADAGGTPAAIEAEQHARARRKRKAKRS